MSGYDKNYDAFEIFEEIVSGEKQWSAEKIARKAAKEEIKASIKYAKQIAKEAAKAAKEQSRAERQAREQARQRTHAAQNADMYYEIEYDSSPIPGAGKFVLKTQKIEEPQRDEIRELFDKMRDIARENRSLLHNSSKFYDRRIQMEKANIFYKQGVFMKDFEDDYEKIVPYSSYFPYYQMMGYEQLRTYFTWRSKVRKGLVEDTSLSYAYLYMYELLGNIGVENPAEGLERLLFFWREFRKFNNSIDKYVLKWLKDYQIYYELPESFQEFVDRNDLAQYYPNLSGVAEDFDLYCAISKYDIRKSVFYTAENQKRIRDCFQFTFERLKEVFEQAGVPLEEAVFQPTKNMALWQPFKDALFHPWLRQRDRRVVLSEKEIYICAQNRWTFNSTLTTESGRQLVGYVMKQMEVALRKVMNFKYKLTANPQGINPVLVARLTNIGVTLEEVINRAVAVFYREATKTVVRVDRDSLAKIRREALQTQEKLIVEEDEMSGLKPVRESDGAELQGRMGGSTDADAEEGARELAANLQVKQEVSQYQKMKNQDNIAKSALESGLEGTLANNLDAVLKDTTEVSPWDTLKHALSSAELEALGLLLKGGANLKQFADEQGMMLEVLMDGINEKAQDTVGDSLFDEEFVLYEDYVEDVRRMVEL